MGCRARSSAVTTSPRSTPTGHIDVAQWKTRPGALPRAPLLPMARTTRSASWCTSRGGSEHARWVFDYDAKRAEADDESGYRFGAHAFRPGEYVTIRDDEGETAHLPRRCRWNRRPESCDIELNSRAALMSGAIARHRIAHARADRRTGQVPIPSSLKTLPPPPHSDGAVLVRALALGICGTDREIIAGDYGWRAARRDAPDPRPRVARPRRGGAAGQRLSRAAISSSASCAVPIRCRVRPAPSANGTCAATASTPSAASRSATATAPSNSASSPTSPSSSTLRSACSACCSSRRAWSPRPGSRSSASARAAPSWQPRVALVTGAGPVGLLAALLGAQRGLDVHVLDRNDGRAEARTWRAISAPPITPAISASSRPTS